jgi:hypothetical protein
MLRQYVGERTVHDVGNFKEFCGSKNSRDWTLGSSGQSAVVVARFRVTAEIFVVRVPVFAQHLL